MLFQQRALQLALWAAALPIALQDLLYHSAGWVSFGYRYTNDFAPYLFVLLAVTGVRFSGLFKAAAAWAVAINLFGAVSFQRKGYESLDAETRALVPLRRLYWPVAKK